MPDEALPPGEPPKKASRDVKRLAVSLSILALQRLSDPDVRAQLAKHGRTLADNAKQWREDRAERRGGPPGFTDRFGRRRLEFRVSRLRTSILALGEGRPELAVQLDPVLGALEEVTAALDVAALLPWPKRLRAHQRVDRLLDELEAGLFDASLPQLPPPRA